jgi:hypothetical protein
MDRFVRGFIIGLTADVFKNIINLFSYYVLHASKLLFSD